MLNQKIQGLPLLLIFSINTCFGSLSTLATPIEDSSQEESSNTARVALPNSDIIKVLETWVNGSASQEEGNLELAREYFQTSKTTIEQITSENQACLMNFNETLLEGAIKNQLPDFLKVESECFEEIMWLLSIYSASTPK